MTAQARYSYVGPSEASSREALQEECPGGDAGISKQMLLVLWGQRPSCLASTKIPDDTGG
ncbi:hypothetical protein H2248_011291 [Termitomyces sp. 'cryptogamus']|nr:hypothetical protein H2248_011291 [Termitomyces sp. 'cryptogamus']